MKFCPQCGTTFEPGARFCLECGFDKSTVETSGNEPVATPPVIVDESSALTGSQPEIHEIKPGCPKCGTELTPDDRFCPECGIDTNTLIAAEPAIVETPVAEIIIPAAIAEKETAVEKENKQFCQQCGTVLDSDERFCQECGFDTQGSGNKVVTGIGNTHSAATNPEPVFIPPPVETISAPPKAPKPIPPPAPEPVQQQTHQQYPSAGTPAQDKKESTKKPLMMILLIVIGIGVLGAGGWFAYNKFIASPAEETTVDTTTSIAVPEAIITDTPEPEGEIAATPTETTTQKPKTAAKPKSKIDQELEKYREQEKNKAAQQSNSSQTIRQQGTNRT